jgi:flagellar hook-basal body complex protein FliE
MDAVSSLPSLNDLLRQNPNLNPTKFSPNLGSEQNLISGASPVGRTAPPIIDKTTPTDRVTAPGFSEMFEKFVRGVDHKKKISAKETQDLILGRSDNIHEAVVKSEEAKVAFNLMIEVRNKLVDSYKELMRMQV